MINLKYIDTVRYENGKPKAMFLLADLEKMEHSKVVIFGTGLEAYFIHSFLEKHNNIEIVCFVNNDPNMKGKLFCGKEIVVPSDIWNRNYYVIIAMTTMKFNNEVIWQLKTHGCNKFGIAFMDLFHAFSQSSLQDICETAINRILCQNQDMEINEIIKPTMNVGPSSSLLGVIPELCWTTTWSNCLMKWFYEEYSNSTVEKTDMLEIGPGRGVFSLMANLINPNINIKWLMFELGDKSEKPVKGKYTGYPSNLFATYYGVIEQPDYCIDDKFDIIVMTEVMEHFAVNPLPTMKKIADMLKPNGRLYISTPNWGHLKIYDTYRDIPDWSNIDNYEDMYIGHSYQYSKVELNEILDLCDLEIERYGISDSNNHNLIARKK